MSDNFFHFALNNMTNEIARPTYEILKEMTILEKVTCDQQESASPQNDGLASAALIEQH